MKKIVAFSLLLVTFTSCATIFSGRRAKITIADPQQKQPVTIVTDGQRTHDVFLPAKVKVKRGYKPSSVQVESSGYEPYYFTVYKKFNPTSVVNLANLLGWGIDAATGSITKPDQKSYIISMQRSQTDSRIPYQQDPTIPEGEATNRVSRDHAGQTALEQTIIRWFFDSDPQGARIFYRVISSVPAEVKNTNETYLMTTPFEETRSFNILGLTYENSRNVQIEIKVMKSGYEPQVKRCNVRQAIDQQEISGFFMLVKKEE